MARLDSSASPPAGLLNKALRRLFMRHASVTACEEIADRFHLISLEGPALTDIAWTAGQKIQIAMGSAFTARTYTPIDWDAASGRTRILGYAHGKGPGSSWLAGLKTGDECDIFGPHNSLNASRVIGPLAIFGDETSIGLAHAFQHKDESRPVSCRFEVNDVESSRRVRSYLGLADVVLFGKAEGDAHLAEMEASLPALAAAGATFVLTGKASTIQRLKTPLKRLAIPTGRILAKAYWAPGKTGLD